MDINQLLKTVVGLNASDLHIKVGSFPVVRINGDLKPIEGVGKFTQEIASVIASVLMSDSQKIRFEEKKEVDFSYSVSGLGRFRVNVFKQRGSIGMVFRVIQEKTVTVAELGLPKILEKLSLEPRGLILVTGTSGSGKSTTLAAMIEYINMHRTLHIMTIEDPIEYLYTDKKSLINQREIRQDAESFASALRSALRQDPDVILVGEMRDFETISTAITAAETGHLVLSTLHTVDSVETINRIIGIFPQYQQKQIRFQLSSVLKGVVSMRLVPRADGMGRVPAVEVMVATATIRECILDPDRTRKIHDVIAAGASHYGMQTFDQSLYKLYTENLITFDEAVVRCNNPDDFALKVKGVQSDSDTKWVK
ncbi:MAG: type IV pilus twitching motility protein PilT [Nitrospirae bacterium]|nr:type IV pilus twitching motility protein PilT [Nitrospirota bacterium]